MATIYLKVLDDYLREDSKKALRDDAIEIAQSTFDEAKEEFLDSFLHHPVSEEIEQGAKLEGGMLPTGNLFGFIGFQEGDDPIGDLYRFLDEEIQLDDKPKYSSAKHSWNFNVYIPSKDDIKDVTPMEWGTARSWAFAIESGLPGLNRYLFDQNRDLGRSTGGIQVKGIVNDVGAFRPRKYMSDLLNQLEKNL